MVVCVLGGGSFGTKFGGPITVSELVLLRRVFLVAVPSL